MYAKPVIVNALTGYRIKINFADGISGIVDLSHLAGKGVFKVWENDDFFSKVYINSESDAIAWNEELELCPNTLYEQLISSNVNIQSKAS